MSNAIINVEGIGKKYILTHQRKQPYYALRDVMASTIKQWGNRLIHPLASRRLDHGHEEFWALKDVSFEIKQGDRVGIIGRNGAGKSTLLKILSRITEPSTGKFTINGRVASLLEVGTGFHPELTGRENIYLNGAILGMTKAEIKRKFDEIVDFAEVEKFLDTPVKRYSSGMYVRLAFAVAAHLEPEILLVDEVLAVGDAQFQKKCLGKMEDISSQEGRTVFFVSHNMNMIRQLCNQGILLEKGSVRLMGDAATVVSEYLTNHVKNDSIIDLTRFINNYGDNEIKVLSIELLNAVGNSFAVPWDEPIRLKIKFMVNREMSGVTFGIGCTTLDHVPMFTIRSSDTEDRSVDLKSNQLSEASITIHHNLRAGLYNLMIGISSGNYVYYYHPGAAQLEILNSGEKRYLDSNTGLINCPSDWLFT